MRKMVNEKLFRLIRDYITIYLPEHKYCSQETVKSYRDSLNLLLDYVTKKKKIPLEKITFSTLNHRMVADFLNWLEKERKCRISTRNLRLSSIRSFFKYAGNMDPVLLAYWNDLQKIPLKKDMKSKSFEFMSEKALKTLLAQPDPETKKGMRNLFFMILMYDTAARNKELLELKIKDFSANVRTPCVYLTGKGRKKRVVPVMQKTVEHFYKYIDVFHSQDRDPNQYLFYTTIHNLKGRMSEDNVARFLNNYSQSARNVCNEMPARIHPHMIRNPNL